MHGESVYSPLTHLQRHQVRPLVNCCRLSQSTAQSDTLLQESLADRTMPSATQPVTAAQTHPPTCLVPVCTAAAPPPPYPADTDSTSARASSSTGHCHRDIDCPIALSANVLKDSPHWSLLPLPPCQGLHLHRHQHCRRKCWASNAGLPLEDVDGL